MHRVAYALYSAELLLVSCRPLSSLSVLHDYRSWSSIRFGTTVLGHAIVPAIIYAAERRDAPGCLRSLQCRASPFRFKFGYSSFVFVILQIGSVFDYVCDGFVCVVYGMVCYCVSESYA